MQLPDVREWLRANPKVGLALLAVVILVAVYFLFLQNLLAPKVWRVNVVGEGGERVDGATVELYDGAKRVARGTTEKGVAEFTNLPEKLLQVRVSRQGYEPANATLDTRARTSVRVELAGGPGPVVPGGFAQFTVRVIDRSTQRGIPGATINYAYDSSTGTATTDASGLGRVSAPAGARVALRVGHANYSFEALTVLAEPREHRVVLRRSAVTARLSGAPGPRGTVLVSLTGDNNRPILSGTLRVMDSATSAQLGSASIANGSALVGGLPLKARAYLEADAKGYLTYSGADKPFEVKDQVSIKITLVNESKGAPTKFITRDAAGNPLDATVLILPRGTANPFKELKTSARQNGTVTQNLAVDQEYYAVAFAPGYLQPARSTRNFRGGADVVLTLERATAANAANLVVTALNEDARPISGARVALVNSEGLYAAAGSTGSNGQVNFSYLRKGERLRVHGNYQGVNVSSPGEVSLGTPTGNSTASPGTRLGLQAATPTATPRPANATATPRPANATATPRPVAPSALQTFSLQLTFELTTAFVEAAAVDAINGRALEATFYAVPSFGSGNVSSICTAGPGESCVLRVRTSTSYSIVASSTGYANTSQTLTLKPGERVNATLRLVPAGFVTGTKAEFLGLFTSEGNPVDFVRPGGEYTARLRLLTLPDVHESTLYLRAGAKPSLNNESAGIESFPQADLVAKSTSYQPGPNCTDLNNNTAVDGLYKWVELSYRGGGVREAEFRIAVSPLAPHGQNLSLFYRAAARFDGNVSRHPEDARFQGRRDSPSLSGCYAQVLAAQFPISLSPEAVADVGRDFTTEAGIKFNQATGQVEATASEFVLQVDALMPGDTLPLKFSAVEVLVAGINSTAGTEPCYRYDTGQSLLVFASKELNPNCPLKMEGGRPPTDSSASMTFFYTKSPSVKLTVPIRVKAGNATSLALYPREPRGDGAPRVVYVVNNLQSGLRTLKAEFGAETRDFNIAIPAIRPVVLRGDGEFVVKEDRREAAKVNYEQEPSYFKGIAPQGTYLDGGCESPFCCTEAWCDGAQTASSFTHFARYAQSLAGQTFFRRGNGRPYNFFSPVGLYGEARKAALHLLVQSRQSAFLTNQTEQEGGVALKLPDGFTFVPDPVSEAACTPETPVAWDVTAESANGTEWTLTPHAVKLASLDYYGAKCAGAGAEMLLCGWLYGEGTNETNACLKRVTHTVTASFEQADEFHANPEKVESAFDPTEFLGTCQQAANDYSASLGALDSECSRIADTFKGCAAGADTLGNCGAANCELQDATTECGENCQAYTTEGTGVCAAAAITCSQVCTIAKATTQTAIAAAQAAASVANGCYTNPGAAVKAQAGAALLQTAFGLQNAEKNELATAEITSALAALTLAEGLASAGLVTAKGTCNVPPNNYGCAAIPFCANAIGLLGTAISETGVTASSVATCVSAQVAVLAAGTGGAVLPFEQDEEEVFYSSGRPGTVSLSPSHRLSSYLRYGPRNSLLLQGAGDQTCNAPIGDQTLQYVGTALTASSSILATTLASASAGAAGAIGCTIVAVTCATAVQAKSSECQENCQERAEKCGNALIDAATKAGTCENTKGYLYEYPANLPTRAAWYTCYPYSDTCHPACQPKKEIAQLVPWQKQMLLIERGGLTNACVPTTSDLFTELSGKQPNELLAAIAGYRNDEPVENGFFGVMDAATDPLSGAPDQGSLVDSRPIAPKLQEVTNQLFDETTNFTKRKDHLKVYGGLTS